MTELRLINATTGSTVYAVVSRDSDEKIWSTANSSFISRVLANQADYAVNLAESPAGSRVWLGDLPVLIPAGVVLNVDYYIQAGPRPDAVDDTLLGTETLVSGGLTLTPASGNLISADNYRTATQDTNTPSVTLNWLITAASSAIESYCQAKLMQEIDRIETKDGHGTNLLSLDGVPVEITSVTLDPYAATPENVDAGQLTWTAGGSLFFKPTASHRFFPCGNQNVKVVYTTAGIVQGGLEAACVLVVKALLAMMDNDSDVTVKSVRDVTMKFNHPAWLDLADEPMFAGVRRLLQPYVRLLCV